MIEFIRRELVTSASEHLYFNLFLFALYFRIFLSIAKSVAIRKSFRNGFALSVALISLTVSLNFLFQAFLVKPSMHPEIALLWHFFAAVPALLFMFLRKKQGFILGAEDTVMPYVKFNKLKEDFLSVASHELRTPLSVITGFAEILIREKLGPLNDEQKRRIRKILLQGQRLNRIIDDLLDLSRIRSGKIEIRRDVFDPVAVLKASLDDHQIVCEQQNLQLVDEVPDSLPDVVGDLERFTQIVINLLNNSIKYTEAGGKVTLRAREDKNNRVRFEIQDSGIGIDAQDLPFVFQEFYRSQNSKKYAGTGLGLTIVKQLVEAQGGEVGVQSEGQGKGSIFYFTMQISKTQFKDKNQGAALASPKPSESTPV